MKPSAAAALTESVSVPQPEASDRLAPTRLAMERALLVVGERTELILVRHAQQRRTTAELDRPGGSQLSDLGRLQAQLTGEYLFAEAADSGPVDAVYCSHLNRARETAEIIAAAIRSGLEAEPVDGLREVDMYGRNRGNVDLSPIVQGQAGEEFGRTLRWDAFPNTEPAEDLRRRICTTVEQIAMNHPNGRVVIVSHAGAISALFAELIGARPDMFYFAGHASVNRLFHAGDSFATHSLNEVAHLRARRALTF